ncbi:hypothetical protein TUM18999_02990 [Pseudomonas tohonis]|uniref:Uncharacterized protein n=1 Tax=Pseudomonas tohonis TaxID=2725477 RepID=A0A6J4DY66_9PSED|nr:hypothetical protein [Pseudomonas tohonis]BCG22108.1 hypothetical protein TUM18999_02990 [Pseudomonas tohonis]
MGNDVHFWIALEAVFGAAIVTGADPEHLRRTALAIVHELEDGERSDKVGKIIQSASRLEHLGVQA